MAPTTSPVKSTLSIEERAVRDALERFVRKTQMSEITVEPSPYLSESPADIGSATVTVMTRKQLAEHHAGDEVAPTITTINLHRPKSKSAPGFYVSIGRMAAATSGFKNRPYGMIITYSYVVKNGSTEMISEAVEVE